MRSKEKHSIKLPAIKVLHQRKVERLREEAIKHWEFVDLPTYREIAYREEKEEAFIEFEFYNGAMYTEVCEVLLDKPLMDYVDEVSEILWRALKA